MVELWMDGINYLIGILGALFTLLFIVLLLASLNKMLSG